MVKLVIDISLLMAPSKNLSYKRRVKKIYKKVEHDV